MLEEGRLPLGLDNLGNGRKLRRISKLVEHHRQVSSVLQRAEDVRVAQGCGPQALRAKQVEKACDCSRVDVRGHSDPKEVIEDRLDVAQRVRGATDEEEVEVAVVCDETLH